MPLPVHVSWLVEDLFAASLKGQNPTIKENYVVL